MSKEKQIDEIAKLICNFSQCVCYNSIGECANTECQIVDKAETLYNIGYRKQSDGEWISIKIPTGVEAFGVRETQDCPKCSVCGYIGDVSECHFKYCPNCGAKMKCGE